MSKTLREIGQDVLPAALAESLGRPGDLAIAVSGGVDSMTLAHAAYLARTGATRIVHAVSPAVPVEATERVRRHADAARWNLNVVEAGEFSDPDYLRNPVNRCYFCKKNLYDRVQALASGAIASGANLDDLGDYRPGLVAARERRVIHPFVEAGMSKADVRQLADRLGLHDIAELPAQPCLASRIETGLTVTAKDLVFVAEVERSLATLTELGNLRCRIVAGGVRVEIDDVDTRDKVEPAVRAMCEKAKRTFLGIGPYRRGSAFLR